VFVADDDAVGGRRKEEDSFLSAINIGRSITRPTYVVSRADFLYLEWIAAGMII